MRRIGTILGAALLLLGATPTLAAAPALVVIVHPQRGETLSVQDVANIYLRKRRFWNDGTPIVPLNQDPGGAMRERFSSRVLGAASADFASYWNEQYFQGVFPPATLSSTAAVKRYVAADANAIGYIEADGVDGSVRVVLRLE
jgi:ABC-type phosphate transport system substrate-binding protein